MLKVILMSGKACHGKDTAGKIFRDILISRGRNVRLFHFADLLKFICIVFLGWDGEKDEKGRIMLQHVGTEIFRCHDPNYFVNFVCDIITLLGKSWDYVIIPDTRFPNEIETLKSHGFDVLHLRVFRTEKGEEYNSKLSEAGKSHSSETALDNTAPDYTIVNTGYYGELYSEISEFIKERHM